MAIVEENRDPIPFRNTHSQEEMTESVDPLVNLKVCEGLILKDQSFLLRLKETPFSYPITDVHLRDKSSLSPFYEKGGWGDFELLGSQDRQGGDSARPAAIDAGTVTPQLTVYLQKFLLLGGKDYW